MKKKMAIFVLVLLTSVAVGHRVRQIRREGVLVVHNAARIHAESGVPHEYVVAKKTTDVLLEPLFVQNGRALVSAGRAHKFAVGDMIHGKDAKITYISPNVDLDTGMFIVRVSGNVSGNVFVRKKYTGFFLPADAVLPDGARMVARDGERMVAAGLRDGDKVIVK
jgi:hypothetical protein